jgi:predicted flap endonuclease-1-like 5' DNA nuclease
LRAFSVIALGVFGIVFSLFVVITGVFMELPPGNMLDGIGACLLNGVVYGLIAWLIFAVVDALVWSKKAPVTTTRLEPKPVSVPVEVPKPTVPTVKADTKAGIPIIEIEGIGPVYSKKLNSLGIITTTDLLDTGGTPEGRQDLSEKAEITESLILEWVNLSDLMRIRGVGEEYSDLLEEAGVDTVVELARRNPENLHMKMREVNARDELVRKLPTLNDVTSWIDQAKTLPRKIEY